MPSNTGNIVRRTLDLNNPPPLTTEQKARLEALARMPDEHIDYSDAPHRPDAVWLKAGHLPPTKKQITLRLDADVLSYFQNTGKRYQTRINAVLRAYVEAAKKNTVHSA